ncbi:MAG: glutathione binding-like protein [Thiotrichales bacterium]|nr:glutathione binding-like protein [Thiotrichales bacterium]MCY4286937.1 glutathione binding-like protein [Thiotrichales bacterium]MCY4348390.1 glutathione binding-like protein [Thiotrichales bacterium]
MKDLDSALLANRRSVMSLYSDPTDPSSHAVRFVLAEKAINVEIHHVTIDNKPEDLNDLNPYSAILTLVDRDLVLYEPQIIMEYLDERFPHPPLMPVDPVARASNRLYRYRVQRDFYALVDDVENGDKGVASAARKCLRDHLSTLAPIFAQKTYFMSDDYSLVDCYLAPILWRLPAYGVRLPAQAKALQKFADRIFEREAFAQSLTEAEHELRSG